MAKHKDLSKIVAFDTFVANTDRRKGNFFYDKESDHYYAIDLEATFSKNLAAYACEFIELIIEYRKLHKKNPSPINGDTLLSEIVDNRKRKMPTVSGKELAALKIYRDVLKKLLKLHTPESLHEKLHEVAMEGGLVLKSGRSAVVGRLAAYKASIRKNYDSCKKLVALLDKLFATYS